MRTLIGLSLFRRGKVFASSVIKVQRRDLCSKQVVDFGAFPACISFTGVNNSETLHSGGSIVTENDYDLHTFIAESALRPGMAFNVQCNCGGVAPVTPPLKTEFVVCPKCLSKIRLLILEGDPGYILGRDPQSGKEFLIRAQGSSVPPPETLPDKERARIIAKMKKATGHE